jgi:hypothetical protein
MIFTTHLRTKMLERRALLLAETVLVSPENRGGLLQGLPVAEAAEGH